MWNFQGSCVLVVEFPIDVTQFYGISRGGALVYLEFPGVKQITKKSSGMGEGSKNF